MRKKLLLLSLTFLSLFSCRKEIIPYGDVTIEHKSFSNFSSIEVEDGLNAILTYSNTENVEIETNDNIHRYIVATQNGNKITFKKANYVYFAPNTSINIFVDYKSLSDIDASGGSTITTTNQMVEDNLSLNLSGGSSFFSDIDCRIFSADISGGSNVEIIGISDIFNLNSSGGSNFEDFGFSVRKLTCDISGGGKTSLTVYEKLYVTASGGSIINYAGTGVVCSKCLSGGSQLNNY